MALTVDEMRIRDTAQLEGLIAEVMVAKRDGNNKEINDALDALNDFITKTPVIELQNRANDAVRAADADLINVALSELAEIAAKLNPTGEVFKSAAQIAASGKAELLFPRLAATAAHSLEIFSELQDAIDKLKAIPANINSFGNVPDALNKVKVALTELQDKVKNATPGQA